MTNEKLMSEMTNEKLISGFEPRWYQQNLIRALFKEKKRKAVLVWSRRCLDGYAHITMADGSWKYLKDIKVGDKVLSHNGSYYEEDTVVDHWDAGIKDGVRLNNTYYMPLISSKDHRFAHLNSAKDALKWKPIGQFTGSLAALQCARGIPGTVHDPDRAEFIGYLQSDGYVVGYQQPKFTNTNIDILKRVDDLVTHFGCMPKWRKKGNGYDIGISNGTKGGATPNGIKQWFRDAGQDVQKSRQRIHPDIWQLDDKSVFSYLSALISCDGSLSCRQSTSPIKRFATKTNVEVIIHCGSSEFYAFDVYWLLRKVGILPQRPKLERNSNWKVRISKVHSLKKLLNNTHIVGKLELQQQCVEALEHMNRNYQEYMQNYNAHPRLEETTAVHMYDIQTKKNHNFVANGYLVHNSGKDFIAWQIALWYCLSQRMILYYIFPTQRQARDAIWSGIAMDGNRFMDFVPPHLIAKKNESRMEITFKNGSILALKGSTNYDSLRGSNPKVVIFSEYAYCDQRVYPEIIHPIIEAQRGTVLFISTPMGKNHFYNLYELAKATPDSWYVDYLTVEDTGHIDIHQLKEDVANGLISEDQMLAEYYCKWDRGITGSIFGKYLHKIRLEDRLTAVPHEYDHPVHQAFDLGWDDSTAIIFFQVIGQTIRIVDCYQNNRQPLEHYVRVIQEKGYPIGKTFLPHDGKQHELISGMTRVDKLTDLGLDVHTIPRVRIVERIEQARCMFAKLWIDDKKCEELVVSLENYRREYDDKLQRYKETPVHDKFSHYADAFSYMAMAIPECRSSMTQEDANALRAKALQSHNPHGFRNW